jgi:hypothetical protein
MDLVEAPSQQERAGGEVFFGAEIFVVSSTFVPLSVAILSAEPRHIMISTTIGARQQLLFFRRRYLKSIDFIIN